MELRREQYTLRDSYSQVIFSPETVTPYFPPEPPQVEADIEVLPLGVKRAAGTPGLIFRKWESLVPANYTEEDLVGISEFYWKKQGYKPSA